MKVISVYNSDNGLRTSIVTLNAVSNTYFVEKYEMSNNQKSSFYDVETFNAIDVAEDYAEDWVKYE